MTETLFEFDRYNYRDCQNGRSCRSRWTSRPEEAAVREIAYRVGFKSAAHFSRMFKRAFDVSPGKCRATSAAPARV